MKIVPCKIGLLCSIQNLRCCGSRKEPDASLVFILYVFTFIFTSLYNVFSFGTLLHKGFYQTKEALRRFYQMLLPFLITFEFAYLLCPI